MHLHSWLLCALSLSESATAFYPYKYAKTLHDDMDSGGVVERRQPYGGHVGEHAETQAKPVKMTMKRRPPPVSSAIMFWSVPANIEQQSKFKPHDWSLVETNAIARREQPHPRHRPGAPVKRDNGYNVVTAAKPSQTNSAPIDEDGTDFSYFAPLSFGSKGTLMYMLIDTGAANTWVMGSDCTTEACNKHNTFGESDSTTLRPTGDTFNLTYGTGSVSGVTVNDTVHIAGMSIPLSFGAASTTSNDFLGYPMDGILGLGRSASNTMQFPTVMEAIGNTIDLPANLFGVNLQRDSDGSTNGELNFGAPDTTRYTGDLSYTETVSDGKMWEIPVDDAGFDGNLCKFTGKSAVIDTGTTFILLPPTDSKQLHSQIPQSQQSGEMFHIPCSTKQPVQIIISGVSYNITPKDYIGKPLEGGSLCESNIIGRQAFGSDEWLLGDVFLKNVYTVFDLDQDRIGKFLAVEKRLFAIKTDTCAGFGLKDESSTSAQSVTASATTKLTSVGSTTVSASASSVSPTALLPERQGPSSSVTSASTSHSTSGSKPSSSTASASVAATLGIQMSAGSIVFLFLCLSVLI